MYRDFGTVFFAAIVAVIFVIVPLVIQWLIAPTNKTKEKLETYECGEVVEGSAWLQFNIRFYVIALIFLILFEVLSSPLALFSISNVLVFFGSFFKQFLATFLVLSVLTLPIFEHVFLFFLHQNKIKSVLS